MIARSQATSAVASVLAMAALAVPVADAAVAPRRAVAQARAQWLKEVRASARDGDRATRFPSPPRRVLVRRLERAATRYDFRIVRVTMLRPLQRVPVVVIRSSRKHAMARVVPKIIEAFDPRRPTRANPSGYAYEAYFLVAEDRRGTPYLATFNHWRPPRVGGGEWAAAESIYPFPHG